MYDVKLGDLEHVRQQLFTLWSQNLPVTGDLEARLRWYYQQAPHGAAQVMVLHEKGEVIGCGAIGVRTVWIRGSRHRAALFGDLAIDKRHRSGLPAIRLVRAIKEEVSQRFDLGYGFPNAKAVAVYRRSGYKMLGEMPRYVRVLRSRSYLQPFVGKILSLPMAALADSALAAMAAVNQRMSRGYELRWPGDFTPEFDELWHEASEAFPIACERTRAYLRWRVIDQPGEPYRIASAHDRATGRLRAYAVLRGGTNNSIELSDLFGANEDELHALLSLLVPALSNLGAAAICFRFLGMRRMVKLLAAHGFSRRADTRAVVCMGDAAELDPNSWYLTDLDEDT